MLVFIKSIKITLKPNTANPATPSPMIVPPVKLTLRPFERLVRAASVVLTFASVAILIPMFPATAENIAPITKATTMNQCVVATIVDTRPSRAPAITTNTANSLYSAFKNASAPS